MCYLNDNCSAFLSDGVSKMKYLKGRSAVSL